LPEEFYVPDPDKIGVQSKDSKQARDLGDIRNDEASVAIKEGCAASFRVYHGLIAKGVPRELARSVLPVATYSHMFASVDLLNLLKFLTLRCDGHAQYEIRVYADAMREMIRSVVPVCVSAWEGGGL
jgi:thymidylate synthase (FAD)